MVAYVGSFTCAFAMNNSGIVVGGSTHIIMRRPCNFSRIPEDISHFSIYPASLMMRPSESMTPVRSRDDRRRPMVRSFLRSRYRELGCDDVAS